MTVSTTIFQSDLKYFFKRLAAVHDGVARPVTNLQEVPGHRSVTRIG
jgi:hypothetical protein